MALSIQDEKVEVNLEPLFPFFETLVHIVRNSVDHGIEPSDLRRMLGKPEKGKIELSAECDDSEIRLQISDDGCGINIDELKKSAINKKLITKEKGESLSDQDALDLIFQPGFSSKEEVTDMSGRGVGLDAVKAAIAELKGKTHVQTELGKGTTFEFRIPVQ